jgi:hypothetical protein
MRTSVPPRLVTASTRYSVSEPASIFPISATGFRTPVEVSAWTTATTAKGPFFRAAAVSARSTGFPHSNSRASTCAPRRPATSCIRRPKTPLVRTRTRSPGSTRLTKQASIPAEPVPDMGRVRELFVFRSSWSMDFVPSMMVRKYGSRCPRVGFARAS